VKAEEFAAKFPDKMFRFDNPALRSLSRSSNAPFRRKGSAQVVEAGQRGFLKILPERATAQTENEVASLLILSYDREAHGSRMNAIVLDWREQQVIAETNWVRAPEKRTRRRRTLFGTGRTSYYYARPEAEMAAAWFTALPQR